MRELPFSCFLPWPRPAWEAAELKKGGGGGRVGGGGCGGGGGVDPGRAVIRQAERKTTSGTQSGTPPSSSFLQTPSIMSKLSCGSKYSLHSVGFEVANRRYCCLPSSLFFSLLHQSNKSHLIARGQLVFPWNQFILSLDSPPCSSSERITVNTLKRKAEVKVHITTVFFIDEGFLCKLGLSRDPHQLSL